MTNHTGMKQYRVKGISCAGCAQRMEQEIQSLAHGDNAQLHFNTGRLVIHEEVALDKVKQILKSDGASLMDYPSAAGSSNSISSASRKQRGEPHESKHSHKHDHSHNGEANDRAEAHDDHVHQDGEDGHEGHDHSHAGGWGQLKGVIIAVVLYAAALIGESYFPAAAAIGLYLAATAISGYTTFLKGLKNLLKLKFTMDTLMTVALVGAVAIGEWKEATLVAILFGLNEWLEGLGMERARRSMEALLSVAPKEAILLDNGRETVVAIAGLRVGDIVKVRPGDQIPSDGIVREGSSSVSEAAITGESLPLEKATGDSVFGGSINHAGLLLVEITKPYDDSSLARILHLVQQAQETKTPTELFINRFARYYTPAIMLIALLVFLAPPLLFGKDWTDSLYQGLSVLIVGCPCALILASPIAIVSGIARTARHGILVKGGVYLESLGRIDTIAFDKTGTLTKGDPHVAEWKSYTENRLLAIAGAIEQTSSHPLAKAILKEADRQGVRAANMPENIQNIAGSGVEATIEGRRYRLGNEKSLAAGFVVPPPVQSDMDRMKEAGLTLVVVSDDDSILGLFGVEDEVREESPAVIAALHRLGIRNTVMLTGDHRRTAERVAGRVGLTDFRSGLMPEDKVNAVRELTETGSVAMIGDGVNDAPALAAAKLGIAMGKGTDSALETADVVLMQDHLGKLPVAIQIARRMNRIIRLNIGIAMGLKLAALLLTIPGWLTLWIAILSDMGATVLVTLIGLTLFIEGRSSADNLAGRSQ